MATIESLMRYKSPNEVGAAPAYPDIYRKVALEQDDIRQLYHLPAQYTKDTYASNLASECPLIVFVNSRSGGRVGSDLTLSLHRRLGRAQVFDLSKDKPDQVLRRLWSNFDEAANDGDQAARAYQSRLRILVAGGDGTIAWVLGTLKALDLSPMPPVAIIPMGTGNDLSRSLGWGGAFRMNWIKSHESLRCTLQRIAVAKVVNMDSWTVAVHFPKQELIGKFPYSIQVDTDGVAESPTEGPVARGTFWNYMSVGMDAKSAHAFHSLRDKRPWLTVGRLSNQLWYSVFSCTSGWFCCTKPLTSKVSLQVIKNGSETWEDVPLANEIKALVILNLQSYAGGRDLWGEEKTTGQKGLHEPGYNDKNLEVVGLTSGYHTAMVMASSGLVHARRLCQASAIRFHLRAKHTRPDGTPSHAYLQIDGEPWMQDVPSSNDKAAIMVEIAHNGTSKMLKNIAGLHSTVLDSKWVEAVPRPTALEPLPSSPALAGVAAVAQQS